MKKQSPTFAARLADLDALARTYLRRTFDGDDSAMALYMTHHLEELSDAVIKKIFAKPKRSIDIDYFLSRMFLKRAELDPRAGKATFDYTIDVKATQYVVAVRLDERGRVLGAEMES